MDLKIFEKMNPQELKNYIQFLLWHYRIIDASGLYSGTAQ